MRKPPSPVGWLLEMDFPKPLSRAELSTSTTSVSRVAPPPMGNTKEGYTPLGDAPGDYVLQR
jgi:hypothetical protein